MAVFASTTLALGMGVATATYSVIYTGLWRPLGLHDENHVVVISRSNMFRPGPTPLTWADYRYLEREQQSLSSLAAWCSFRAVLIGQKAAELVDVELVTGRYFATLGVSAAVGRTINPADDQANAPRVVVLSDSTWRDQFKGDPDIVGRTVKLANYTFTVIGVSPPGFRGVNPDAFETKAAWIPLGAAAQLGGPFARLVDSAAPILYAAGRVKPDRTLKDATDEVTALGERIDVTAPLPPYKGTPTPVPVSRHWTTGQVRDAERLSASGNEIGRLIVVLPSLVLLIACTNIANLVLSRGMSRQHEFAVRRSLGATRWQLVREQLIEHGAVTVFGGILGLVVSQVLVTQAVNVGRETVAPFIRSARIDWTLDAGVLQATAIAMLSSLAVFGLVPSLHLTRDSLRTVLDRGSVDRAPRWRGRGNLIALQVGVSVGLFLIAVIFIRMLLSELPAIESNRRPGLEKIAVAAIPFNQQARDERQARQTIDRILGDAELSKGDVAITSGLPSRYVHMFNTTGVTIIGSDAPFRSGDPKRFDVEHVAASRSLFDILGLPLQFGRLFDDHEDATGVLPVVVNRGFALDAFGVANATGRELFLRVTRNGLRDTPRIERATIVGVVAGDVVDRHGRHEHLLYLPFSMWFEPHLAVVARPVSNEISPTESLREAIRRADPELAVDFLARGDVWIEGPLAFAPYLAAVLLGLAVLALVLAMVGLYGVLSHVVARRTREFGIRLALGAQPRQIARVVFKDGFRPIVEGLFIGLASAFVVRFLMTRTLSLTTAPVDPVATILAIVLLALAGVTACSLPVRRATQVDPNVALRDL